MKDKEELYFLVTHLFKELGEISTLSLYREGESTVIRPRIKQHNNMYKALLIKETHDVKGKTLSTQRLVEGISRATKDLACNELILKLCNIGILTLIENEKRNT